MKNTGKIVKISRRLIFCIVAALLIVVLTCVSTAIALSQSSTFDDSEIAKTNSAVYDEMQKAAADYVSEKVIPVGDDIAMNASTGVSATEGYVVKAGQSVRFVAASENAKLTFSVPFTVEAEGRAIFEVETRFNAGGNVTVYGTLRVNHRMYNAATITVGNLPDDNAEVKSEGILVNGSLNNDAANGGTITVNSGATLATVASTTTTVNTENGASPVPHNDGGALMLKANGAKSLQLTVAADGLVNGGSIIYDNAAAAPSCSDNSPVAAQFNAPSTALSDLSGVNVMYASTDTEVSLTDSVTLGSVNLLSFGKVTYKLNKDKINFTVSQTASLGGGESGGATFTQGANELVFDGGAKWDRGTAPSYGNISTSTIIFYGADNQPFVYENSGHYGTAAFFTVNGGGALSAYGGAIITNYDMQGGDKIGGGVGVSGSAKFNMYGGEISWCAVTHSGNNPSGGGIMVKGSGSAVSIYGGAVTHNAIATYIADGSADGAGVAVCEHAEIKIYGGEISYNHGAVEYSELGADGGGMQLHNATGYMYGGEIRGNYTGGAGGGVGMWVAAFSMYGGSIVGNHAVYGGGVGVVGWHNQKGNTSAFYVYGGSIEDNNAFRTSNTKGTYGGEGGGICVGSNSNPTNAIIEIGEGVVISGNSAYKGGGLAVYTANVSDTDTSNIANQLVMTGGIIEGNAAYKIPGDGYQDQYKKPDAALGGGVFVNCANSTPSKPMLVLSGNASIDSSNTVSFDANPSSKVAPIQVTGKLGGSGLGALVYIGVINTWKSYPIISFDNNGLATSHLNKFVLDTSTSGSAFSVEGSNKYIEIVGDSTGIARIGTSGTPQSLQDAIANASSGDVIEILQSATLSSGQFTVDKNITIQPADGLDVTLIIAGATEFSTSDSALFYVAKGGSLTLQGTNGADSRLTIDGNGTGRIIEKGEGNVKDVSLVYINGGAFAMQGEVYLRNNITGSAGSAVTLSSDGGTFEMKGGVIENNTTDHDNGGAVFVGAGTFTWTGGAIQNNVSKSLSAVSNYGVYLSSNTSSMKLDNKLVLTDNSVYLGAAKIYVESNFDSDGVVPVVLPEASTLQAGTTVIYGKKDVHEKFEVVRDAAQNNEMSLGSVTLATGDYRNNIVVHKTLTYLLDSRYAYDEDSKQLVLLDDVATSADLASVIANLTANASGVLSVKTRDNKRVLAITISSTGEVPALNKSGASISDVYTRSGYTLDAWTDSKDNGTTVNWNNALAYTESTTNITLYPRWQENRYVLSFDKNAPQGRNTNANVFGSDVDALNFTYSDVGGTTPAKLHQNNWYVVGYAFGGWETKIRNEAGDIVSNDIFTDLDTIKVGNLSQFTTADIRGQYSLTVYAKWLPLFDGGIGTDLTPFTVKTPEQLKRLQQTVNGEAVVVDGHAYYNAANRQVVPYNYAGMYFELGDDIAVEHTGVIGDAAARAFAGTLNGKFKKVTLNGNALFGYLQNARISGVILDGSVGSAISQSVGALAEVAVGGEIAEVANFASVGAAGKTAGGIVGQTNGVQLLRSFNRGSVSGEVAGGVIGKVVGAENTIRNIYNTGAATGASFAGGIVGSASGVLIESVFNGGDVQVGASGKMGAIVGEMGSGVTFSSVYFNTDREYSVKPVAATGSGSAANVTALPSSQMAVGAGGTIPQGMSGFVGNDRWSYYADESGFYYPQLQVFAQNANADVQSLSRQSVQLTVKQDEPLVPEQEFKVNYILNRGSFNFSETGAGTDSEGDYETFVGSSVRYYKSGDNYYTIVKFKIGTDAKVIEPNAPQRVGYDFAGWFVDADCTSPYDFDSGVSATDITLYAKWEAIEYRIAYDLAGGAAVGQQKASFVKLGSSEVVLDVGKVSDSDVDYYTQRIGYKFTHWSYSYQVGNEFKTCNVGKVQLLLPEGGEPTAVLTDTVTNTAVTVKLADLVSNELRFTANWEVLTYTIDYYFVDENGNEIDNVMSNNPTTYTIEQAVSFIDPTRAGYDFQNWHNETPDGEIIHNIPRGNIGNRTIYVVFKAKTYFVTFNTGEGELDFEKLGDSGSKFIKITSSGYYRAGVTFNVAPNTTLNISGSKAVVAAREGYSFSHWSTQRDNASDQYKFDFSAPYAVADDMQLYAIFTVSTFDVTVGIDYRKESGSDEEISDRNARYFLVSEVTALNAKAEERKEDVTIEIPEDAYIAGTEKARCSSYIIHGIAYGRSAYAYLVAPHGEGTFTGWNNLENIVETKKPDLVVTASFILPVKITFTNTYIDTNRVKELGITAGVAVTQKQIDDEKLQPDVTGYEFDCWVDVDGHEVTVVGAVFDKATLLFARYTPVYVTINFVVSDPFKQENGDVPDGFVLTAPASVTVPYDKLFGESLKTLERTGYKFDGWYSAAADGDLVTSNSAVREYVVIADGKYSVTLYANKWVAETYTITLSPGVGIAADFASGVSNTVSYTYADTYKTQGVTVPCDGDNTIIRQGNTLTGWWYGDNQLDVENKKAKLEAGTHGDITLIARWTPKTLTVTFRAQEGYFEVPATIPQGAAYYAVANGVETEVTTAGEHAQLYKVNVQYGAGAVAPLRPFREGYAFSVWDTSYSDIKEDTVVTAEYAIQSYTLYLSAGGGVFGDGSELVAKQNVQFNSPISFADLQKPTRTGHRLTGWKGSSLLLTEGASLNMPARDLTLVAQWEEEPYTVSFEISASVKAAIGGDVAKFFKDNYGITQGLTVTANGATWSVKYGDDLTKLNQTFATGTQTLVWKNGDSIYMFALATQNVNVTAELVNNSQAKNVTFQYFADESYTYPYYTGNRVVFPTPVHNGYTFVGWYANAELSGDPVTEKTISADDEDLMYYAKWNPISYEISYVNGGDLAKTSYKINDSKVDLPTPTRTGYLFDGWFTDSATTEANRFAFESGVTFGNLTLFAKWNVKQYRITVKDVTSNYGTKEEKVFDLAYGGDFSELAKIWQRDFHTVAVKFDGKTVEFNLPNGSALPALDEMYKESGASLFTLQKLNGVDVYTATLAASYNVRDYRINFYNVGNVNFYNTYYHFNDRQTDLVATLPSGNVPAGNTFVNWGVALSGGSLKAVVSYKIELQDPEDGNSGFMIKFVGTDGKVVAMQDMGSVVDLYPMLETTTYTVKFEKLSNSEIGTVTGEMPQQVFVYNVAQALTVNAFVRAGYTFTGWKDAKGITYTNGQVLTLTDDETTKVLTAQWTPNVYQVYFNAGGGALNSEAVKSAAFNTEITLPTPTRAGYTFAGWKIGNATHNAGAKLTVNADLVALSDGNLIEFVAQWTPEQYHITFDANYSGGTVTPSTLPYTVTTAADDLTLPTPTRANYTFGGWYLEAACSNPFAYTQGSTVGNFTLYAKWTAVEYTVTLNANYAGGAVTPATLTYSLATQTLTLPTPSRTGYTFNGWFTEAACTNSFEYEQGTTTGNKELFAKWTAIEYAVTLNANGGTVAFESLTYTVATVALTLPTPTRAGYVFTGWTLNGTQLTKRPGTENEYVIPATTGNITLVATWNTASYKVTFNTGVFGGSVAEATLSFDGEHATQVTLSELSKTGYVFNGWTVGSGSSVYTGNISLAELLNIDAAPADNTFVLNANHGIIDYTITYVLNGGTGNTNPASYNVETATFTLTNPTRGSGYTFEGWYYNARFEGSKATSVAKGTTGAIELYAHWTANPFKVTFSDSKNVLAENKKEKTVYYEQTYGELPALELDGYTLLGWFTAANGGTQVTADTVVRTAAAHTLYAHWEETSYTITYNLSGGTYRTGDNVPVNPSSYTVGSLTLTIPSSPQLQHYVFDGWSLNGTLLEKVAPNGNQYKLPDGTTGNITLVATYSPFSYTIKFFGNYTGTGSPALNDLTMRYTVEAQSLTLPTLEREGYTFGGWYMEAACTNVFNYEQGTTTGNKVLYAKWTPVPYKIAYILNNGKLGDGVVNPDTYTVANLTLTLNEPTRTGYNFENWTLNGTPLTPKTGADSQYELPEGTIGNVTLVANWTEKTYQVTVSAGTNASFQNLPSKFTVKDGIIVLDEQRYNSDIYSTLQEIRGYLVHNSGYNFLYWKDATANKPMSSFTLTGELHVAADWSATDVTLTLIRLNGETELITLKKDSTPAADRLVNSSNDGYSDIYWAAYGSTAEWNLQAITESIVIREIGVAKTDIVVTFNHNYGDTPATTQVVQVFGAPYTLPTNNPTRTGYNFVGWFTAASDGTQVTAETEVRVATSQTLYAHWEAVSYEITYVLNGGDWKDFTPASANTSYSVKTAPVLPVAANINRLGYNFDQNNKWYTDAACTNAFVYTAGTTVGNQTLYAKWTAKTPTVTFDANGGALADSDKTATVTYNQTYGALPTPTRKGHTFAGWFTAASGGKEIIPETLVSNGENHSVFAHWTKDSYSITYNLNGGTNNSANPSSFDMETATIVLRKPTRTGYTFEGWYANAEFSGNEITSIANGSTGNKVLYAKWSVISSVVTFDVKGGALAEADKTKTVTFGQPYGSLPTPTRKGYTFLGWFTDSVVAKQVTAETTVEIVAAQTLCAHWTGKTYNVAFSLNGGSGAATTKSYVYAEGRKVEIPEITHTGYQFNGWFLNSGLTGTAVATTETEVLLSALIGDDSGNLVTLYAKWTAITYTVKIDNVEYKKMTLDDASTSIELSKSVAAGRTMNGWKVKADGAIVIPASDPVTVQLINLINLNANNGITGNVINLYSDVSDNVYTVTFNANRGTLQGNNTSNVTYGATYGTLPTPERAGYTFRGWFTAESGGTPITAQTTVSITASQTLYAHWTVNSYDVSFNVNGGSGSIAGSSVTYGETYGTLPTPTRRGYAFAGWYTEPNGGYQIMADTTVAITAPQTLYAHWSIITYSISYELDGGTNSSSNLPSFTVTTDTITLADPVRAGYTFGGWYDNAEFSGEKVTSIAKDSIGDRILYAKWTSIKYKVVFKNGDQVHDVLSNVALDDADGGIITLTAPTSELNLTYGGWSVENDPALTYNRTVNLADVLKYAQGADNVITFNVVWFDPSSVITYVLSGGVNDSRNPNSYKLGDTFRFFAPTRADYEFVRWYRMEGSQKITVERIDVSIVGDVTLYAEWRVLNYALTVTPSDCTYGETPAIPRVTVKLGERTVNVAGTFVFEYSSNGSDWTTTVPRNAGSYSVRAYYVYAGGEHSQRSAAASFTIAPKAVTLNKLTATGTYGNAPTFGANATVGYNGLVRGDDPSAAIALTHVGLALKDVVGRITVGTQYALTVEIEYESANYTVTVDPQGEFTYEFTKRDVIATIGHVETPYKVTPNLNVATLVTATGLADGDSIADLGVTLNCVLNNGGKVGDYVISGTANSANYNVTFADGVCTVVPLDVTLVIEGGGVYNGEITAAKVVNITCADERVTEAVLAEIKSELSADKFTFIYSGAAFDGAVYDNPDEVPQNAGVYYATNTYTDANYRFSGLSKEFRIEKADNSVTDLTITGWLYGRYDASVNAPKNATALYGEIVYTYSSSLNGPYTATRPQNVGSYYVRAEVAEGANYKAVVGAPVSFTIGKAVLNAPQAVIVTEGDNRNVEYTGRELRLGISGFDSTLMLVSYDGQTIVDGNNVAVVAVNAGTYTVKISIVDTINYAWASGVKTDDDGNVTLVWTVAKKKVAVPKGDNAVIDVSGEYETYIPEGFDASIMEIDGNREAFGGNYTAVITLKDSANYEWADETYTGGAPIEIEWRMDGINKVFVIVLAVLGGLTVVGGGVIGVQYIVNARNKRRQEREIDQRSEEEAADNGSDNASDASDGQSEQNGQE